MKTTFKKLTSFLLTFVMVLGMLPATAMAADDAHSDHSSYVTHVEAVEGNCTTPGNIEFWYCDYYTCEKCYSDEAMTQEISPADAIITPGVHSDECVGCEYSKAEKIFDAFIPAKQPDYDSEYYFWSNGGFHGSFSDRLDGFKFLFVGEHDGKLYAMGNETLDGGSRSAVDISKYVGEDGSVKVSSDNVEFFTYKNMSETYTFSPDNGYMTVLDGKLVVHGENLKDMGDLTAYDVFNQSIRFQQDEDLEDNGKGFLYAWGLNQDIILFDSTGAEPKFVTVPSSSEGVDNRAHNIMLYVEHCDHPNMKHVEAAEVSCTEDGVIGHWYCKDCRLYFADAQGESYIVLPEDESNYQDYLHTPAWGHSYDEDCICENCGDPCTHPNAFYTELEELEPSCFEPGMRGYWFCEDCRRYLDKDQDNAYWEKDLAARIPATGHYFNTDTGVCDECGLGNPVYKKVTSLNDVNEEDLYIIVAEVKGEESTEYFVLGGLEENKPDEQGNVWCPTSGKNAIKVAANESISLVNQDILEDGRPSEFMLDVNPEQFGDMTNLGLTTVMLKLPNYCVYPFQSRSFDYNGYMGVPRYANGVYGMWDGGAWVIDFYDKDNDTCVYEDFYGKQTHASQVAKGFISKDVADGDLLMYSASYVSSGGAMFTLRFNVYNGKYYFIAGEDGFLESTSREVEFGTLTNNGVQYAINLYRYDVPSAPAHTCDFGDWVDDQVTETHTRTCKNPECGKTETKPHGWDNGVQVGTPTCTEGAKTVYTCGDCGATYEDDIDNLGHDWGDWTDDGENSPTDTHSCTCKRDCGVAAETENHSWSRWTPVDDNTHTKTCSDCNGTRTATHNWNDGVITTQPTEDAAGVKTYTCSSCGATKTEPVDKLVHEHSWSDWRQNDASTHIRSCRCNESQTAPHNFDNGAVTTAATHTSKGVKTYTCGDCRYSYTEEIPETTEHQWTDWSDNKDGTHTRSCRCNATETERHTWGEGVVTAPTCTEAGKTTYTCGDCGAIKTEPGEAALNHDWTDWTDTGANATADVHKRSCKRGCGIADEIGNHDWSSWTSTGSTEHKKTCSVCSGERTAAHAWDNGEVTKPATTTTTGTKKYTCSDCGATKTEVIPKVGCDHTWGKWSSDNDETHKHTCVNGKGCEAFQQQAHDWDNGVVTTEPTETTEGVKTYTCLTCSYEKTEAIAMLKHTHSFGRWTSDGADTHTRRCENGNTCTAAETEAHSCDSWSNNGTNHTGRCSVCYDAMSEAHTWGDWEVQSGGSLKRTCTACDAFEEMAVQKPIDETVGNTTDSSDNAAKAELVLESPVELFNSVLTNEEQSAVAGGNTTVSVYLEVEDITDSAPTADVAAAADATAAQNDNSKIGMYLDINLFKEVTTTDSNTSQTETEASQITETNNEVTITITVPDELINTDPNVTRTYKIVRVHDGWAEIIYGDFDPATKTLTFKTSKFSTYALAYADTSTPVYDPYIPAPATYPVSTAPATNGAVKVNYTNVVAGATVTITVEPKTGYTLETLTVLDQLGRQIPVTNAGGGKYTFRMPAGGVTVVPTFMEDNTMLNFFVDVKAGDYYYDAVLWAAINGITKGDTAVTFAPDKACTRAQMVTFLWRAAGCPEPTGTAKGFADVTADSYYSKAVLWAVEQGITNGTGDTTFSPDATCTRAQMATFLCRLAGGKAVGTAAGFTDVKSDAYYAEAVRWAAENGITNGTGDGTTFSPDATCTRGQMVTFLYRYFAN